MTDATESADRDRAADTAGDPGPTAGGDGGVGAAHDAATADDHRPGRPPLLRFFEALGFRRHARLGVVAGIVLAVALYGFFVAVPSIAPGVRGRPESPLLYVVLGFVVAVATALFVTTALTVRTLARAVASPPKWVRRSGGVAAAGGLLWTAGTLAGFATAADAVRPWISVPVLLVVCGVWATHTRIKRLGSPLDRVGTVLATAGVAAVHVAALLTPAPFLGASVEPALTPFAASVATLAVGTALLAAAARAELGALADVAAGLSALGALAVGVALADVVAVSGAVAVVPVALAWVALGVALRGSPTPANWSPEEVGSLLDDDS
ncbi:DUF7536 family protein [Haloarchaeobius baliensis]|uniref:DUF7536 family protein n=1 Tax=Haloarchaeobius baliensis TaxID=1670458 RepID=UPI003F8853D5